MHILKFNRGEYNACEPGCWLHDEYSDDELNEKLKDRNNTMSDGVVGHSPTKPFGKKVKYKDANWMP